MGRYCQWKKYELPEAPGGSDDEVENQRPPNSPLPERRVRRPPALLQNSPTASHQPGQLRDKSKPQQLLSRLAAAAAAATAATTAAARTTGERQGRSNPALEAKCATLVAENAHLRAALQQVQAELAHAQAELNDANSQLAYLQSRHVSTVHDLIDALLPAADAAMCKGALNRRVRTPGTQPGQSSGGAADLCKPNMLALGKVARKLVEAVLSAFKFKAGRADPHGMLRLLLGGLTHFKEFGKEFNADIAAAAGTKQGHRFGDAEVLVKQVVANYRVARELGNTQQARQWLSLGSLLKVWAAWWDWARCSGRHTQHARMRSAGRRARALISHALRRPRRSRTSPN